MHEKNAMHFLNVFVCFHPEKFPLFALAPARGARQHWSGKGKGIDLFLRRSVLLDGTICASVRCRRPARRTLPGASC